MFTPMLVSVYGDDERRAICLCDKCSERLGHPYVWQGFASESATCTECGELNAVDVCQIEEYWRSRIVLAPLDISISKPFSLDDIVEHWTAAFRSDGA